ncbi:MAG TPA: hypothetical protein VFX70_15390, partial [Mycobacteriales bacterium]|nr:hypothetical protein [Mycobacteriales bacterium]
MTVPGPSTPARGDSTGRGEPPHPGPHRGIDEPGRGARPADATRRIRLTGFAGSLLLLVGSLGSGALPVYDPVSRIPVLGALRRGAGPHVALGCVYAGLA